jgi:hypothetical protein
MQSVCGRSNYFKDRISKEITLYQFLTRSQRWIHQKRKGLEPLKTDKYSKAERYQKFRRKNYCDSWIIVKKINNRRITISAQTLSLCVKRREATDIET